MSTRADEALRKTEQTTRRKAAARRSPGFWQGTMDGAHFRRPLVCGQPKRSVPTGGGLPHDTVRLSLKSAPQRSQRCLGRRQPGFGFLVPHTNQGVASYRWVPPQATSSNADRFGLQPSLEVWLFAQRHNQVW